MLRCARRRLLAALVLLLLVACGSNEPRAGTRAASARKSTTLNGAGATFPFPLYSKWAATYNQIHPDIKINYQSIGSGAGIRQVSAGTIDFGATDVPMTAEEAAATTGAILHIPTALGAIAVAYHLNGIEPPVRLSPAALAAIYLGKVKRWNAPEIAEHNPNLALPDREIVVVHRSDGSGSTGIFSDFLGQASTEFRMQVGQGKNINWPVGIGAKGNEGVTGQIRMTPNAIGYVELVYAAQNHLQVAELMNAAGRFVAPSIAASTIAAMSVEMPDTLHTSIAHAPGEYAYPISSYTYLLVPEQLTNSGKGQALADFLWWAIHDGQKDCETMNYAPLPTRVVTQVEQRLKQLRIDDKVALSIH